MTDNMSIVTVEDLEGIVYVYEPVTSIKGGYVVAVKRSRKVQSECGLVNDTWEHGEMFHFKDWSSADDFYTMLQEDIKAIGRKDDDAHV